MTATERRRLVGILGRLGSNHDGERAAAGLLAARLLCAAGLTWEQVIPGEPPPRPFAPLPTGWRTELALCQRHVSFLRPWEREFVTNLGRLNIISPKQRSILVELADALRSRGKA